MLSQTPSQVAKDQLTMKLRVREKEKSLKIIIYIFLTLCNWLKLIEIKYCTKYDQLDIFTIDYE